MLGGLKLKVSYTHERTCFAYVSPKYNISKEQNQCIQILSNNKQLLLWLVYNSVVPEGEIAVNPTFARLIGLDEKSEVFVSPYNDVKVLDELYVDADSPEDQEILEHNTGLLQIRILDQLRLVAANQKAVVWISISLPIVFTPKRTGILVNNSQIIVKVDAFNMLRQPTIKKEENESRDVKFNNIGIINTGMLKPYFNPPKKIVVRALPIDSDGKKDLVHPYTVFLHEDLLDEKYKKLSIILSTLENIPSILEENLYNLDGLCVEIVPINNVVYRSLCKEIYNRNIPTVLIPKSLNAITHIENGMKIIMTVLGDNIEQPEHIDILTYSDQEQSEIEVIEKFKNVVIQSTHLGKKFLINNNRTKQNTSISNGLIKFKLKPENLKYTMLSSESFRHCSISARSMTEEAENLPKSLVSKLDYDYKSYCRTVKCMEDLLEKITSHLYFELHREASFKGVSEVKSNVLLTGGDGSGKTALCHKVEKEVTVWSHILHCRSLKGRKDVPEVLSKAILQCQEHSPAILICDDIDALVPPNLEGNSPQDIAYYQRLAVVIKHALQSCVGVAVLMTATDVKMLHPTLSQFTGKPLFTAHFSIPQLDLNDRKELFKHLVNDNMREQFEIDDEDISRLAMDTDGLKMRDITDYMNKRIFKAAKRKTSEPNIKPRLIESSSKDDEKVSMLDVWDPIGGMEEVKQHLTEAIFWPLMYPVLFPKKSCGILIYGPPGTGKSFIGSCLAASSQVNFIAVKGPELLSKYIGQSEKAVRDIFEKADMKRPCVLFFDEFDSLAPKRGHDSTGVTDRVVNQLLAALDGAGATPSGPVLAATARPDLLDPALLRPGRLQTHLYCGMPTTEDRHRILRTLSSKVNLDPEIDLQELANLTDGFSPADLKSLLVTAQLGSLEEQLDNIKEKSSEMKQVVLTKQDIERALLETKPSLSPQQLKFYDVIYKRFRGEQLSTEEKSMSAEFDKQRVTLA